MSGVDPRGLVSVAAENDALRETIMSLRDDLAQAQRERDALMERINARDGMLDQWQARLATLEREAAHGADEAARWQRVEAELRAERDEAVRLLRLEVLHAACKPGEGCKVADFLARLPPREVEDDGYDNGAEDKHNWHRDDPTCSCADCSARGGVYVKPEEPPPPSPEGGAATHRCKVCGALWRFWEPDENTSTVHVFPAGHWSLVSETCGKCCDNVAMGEQIEKLATPAPGAGACGEVHYATSHESGSTWKCVHCGALVDAYGRVPAPGGGRRP